VRRSYDDGRRGGVLEEALSEERASEGRERLFTNISPVYDVLNDALSLGLHRRWKRRVVELAECKSGDRCLDVCCGSGDLSFLLARKAGPRGSVNALDFSANMLSYAIQRSFEKDLFQYSFRGSHIDGGGGGGENAATIQWIHGDALALPFANSTFDCLTIGYGLRNVRDRRQCLRECHRVLKPGKRAVILDFNSPDPSKQENSRTGLGLRSRFISSFRNLCLDVFVVPTATVCGLRDEYAYLKPSIKAYPDGRELVQMAKEEAGFEQAEYLEMAVGLMGALVLRK
jgi:demethylmenaquinone methyltransferase/2-methoxy-6-polyprenyl-1,4-benzoquinol methylase